LSALGDRDHPAMDGEEVVEVTEVTPPRSTAEPRLQASSAGLDRRPRRGAVILYLVFR
jgi:hypothetical protein